MFCKREKLKNIVEKKCIRESLFQSCYNKYLSLFLTLLAVSVINCISEPVHLQFL